MNVTTLLTLLDLFGVAVLAASGTLAALHAQLDLLGIVVLAFITAIGGGTLRDVLTAQIPLVLHKDIYASAAIAGIFFYLLAQRMGLQCGWAFGISLLLVAGLRLAAIQAEWQLPHWTAAV